MYESVTYTLPALSTHTPCGPSSDGEAWNVARYAPGVVELIGASTTIRELPVSAMKTRPAASTAMSAGLEREPPLVKAKSWAPGLLLLSPLSTTTRWLSVSAM